MHAKISQQMVMKIHAPVNMLRVAIITSIAIQLTTAQLLSAYDQAYGQWKIKMTRNIFGEKWHLETVDNQRSTTGKQNQDPIIKKGSALQLMFPNHPIISHDNDPNTDAAKEDGAQTNAKTIVPLAHKPVRSINCTLNLRRNGKFTIHLDDDHQDNYDNYNNNYQPLRGEWFLTPNPYCVTDRHYDEITLISEPRIRRVYLPSSTVVEKATVQLRCKIWGRYSAGAVRRKIGLKHGRSRSRMTHGNVLTVKETFNDDGVGSLGEATKQLPHREIVGTFCGRAVDDFFDRHGRRSNSVDIDTEEKGIMDDAIIFDDDEGDEYY